MNEMLLQFIWQYSLYSPADLRTTEGEPITVVHPGRRNTNAGPDFEEARIKVGSTLLVGNVELHVATSDWNRHGHEDDKAYRNIILHVLYHDDDVQQTRFPKLELHQHIPAYVLDQYTNLIQTTQPIACARQLAHIPSIIKENWLNRLLAERWEQKLGDWKELLDESAGDWSSLLYWRMAANFGFKVNAVPFLAVAKSIPLKILARHKADLFQVEALLFGQAGMLGGTFEEEYPQQLQREYRYMRQKYKLAPIAPELWKYMRMRPPNFPTIRLAQFAALIHKSLHLFSKIIESARAKDIYPLLHVTASDYWSTHFKFDEEQKKAVPRSLGSDSIDNIIINTIAPVQFLYAHYHGNTDDQERALQLLSSVAAERNKFTTLWEEHGWKPQDAAASQALLQLFNNYCSQKRCLECSVGLNIIKQKETEIKNR